MTMAELLPPDNDLELIHTRNYETRVYFVSDEELLVRGAVRDTKPAGLYVEDDAETLDIHEMHIELRVSLPALTITAVEVLFETHPSARCPHITGHYDNLVGLSIARGFTHKVRELFGGPRGCTHTTALLQAMAPAVVQSVWSVNVRRMRNAAVSGESVGNESRDRMFAANLNTCHVWAEDGEHVASIRRGELPPPPMQVVRRLEKLGRDPNSWRRR
jgi:hypothetical protein